MSKVRDAIRRVPLATESYELTVTRARMLRSRREARRLVATRSPLWLDLGGGYQHGRRAWVNIDVTREADLFWDLR